jgi:hypothetical protein
MGRGEEEEFRNKKTLSAQRFGISMGIFGSSRLGEERDRERRRGAQRKDTERVWAM